MREMTSFILTEGWIGRSVPAEGRGEFVEPKKISLPLSSSSRSRLMKKRRSPQQYGVGQRSLGEPGALASLELLKKGFL